jgi:hypothetical protein
VGLKVQQAESHFGKINEAVVSFTKKKEKE